MPHALLPGTTGSVKKSVAINTMILSWLYKGYARTSTVDHDRPQNAGIIGL